mgnify:CR=1 FL=1
MQKREIKKIYLNKINESTNGGNQENDLETRKQIGYLPELNPLYGEMRVYDILEFIANIRNISGKTFKNSLARVVEQCGLKGVLHKNIAECSKGYKQRIGLACAMIHDPKILIQIFDFCRFELV